MIISNKELQIFSRQLILKDFDETKFKFIQKQHVVIIGIGGIGCPIAQYLVATGFKNLTLIDSDIVKLSNLNRQILFSEKDVGKKKVDIAKKKLSKINTKSNIFKISKDISKKNIDNYLARASLIIDATDNLDTMFLINKYCVKKSIPLLSCSATGYDGQIILFKNIEKRHLCLNCIFHNKNEPNIPRCDTVGILGTTAGLTGLVAAQLTVNFFTNNQENVEKLIMINSKSLKFEYIIINSYNKCVNNQN